MERTTTENIINEWYDRKTNIRPAPAPYDCRFYVCPICSTFVDNSYNFCKHCGIGLDWTDIPQGVLQKLYNKI